jgi:hypothetical protein
MEEKFQKNKIWNFSDLVSEMVTLRGSTWKHFWESMERMSDNLEELSKGELSKSSQGKEANVCHLYNWLCVPTATNNTVFPSTAL